MSIKVDPEFRTNPESHTPGGSFVKITYHGKEPLIYDRIKKPRHYIEVSLQNHPEISEIHASNDGKEWVLIYKDE